MKFYIFRHGITDSTKNHTGYGANIVNAPILPEGNAALEKMGAFLKDCPTDYNAASPYLRVQQTVAIVGKLSGKAFGQDERLGEILWDKDPLSHLYPSTETFEDMRERVQNFLEEIKERKYESVAICTHGGIIAALKHLILDGDFEEHQIGDFPTPGVLIGIDGTLYKEIDFNEH